jgi:hypothetical protein
MEKMTHSQFRKQLVHNFVLAAVVRTVNGKWNTMRKTKPKIIPVVPS